jgi:cytidyltransferase-like protein
VILCSGAFDGIHAGHVRYLSAAWALLELDEKLVVSVAPDEYIRQAKAREPYWSYSERVEVVLELRDVDYVTHDREMTPASVIRTEKPRLFVKGADWRGKLPADVMNACAEAGTQIVYVDTPGRHTSEARGCQ